jgi:hypothetical protein
MTRLLKILMWIGWIGFVIGLLWLINTATQVDAAPRVRDSLATVIYSQVGVREEGGNNRGPEVERYLAQAGLGPGNPWCAAFMKWCMAQVGVKVSANAYSPSWFIPSRVIWTHGQGFRYYPCSVFGIWFNSLGRIGHVGFVMWSNGKTCRTVEGNTNNGGSREGDSVMVRYRPVWSLYQVADWLVNE